MGVTSLRPRVGKIDVNSRGNGYRKKGGGEVEGFTVDDEQVVEVEVFPLRPDLAYAGEFAFDGEPVEVTPPLGLGGDPSPIAAAVFDVKGSLPVKELPHLPSRREMSGGIGAAGRGEVEKPPLYHYLPPLPNRTGGL